jgi:hypothetical protein
VSHPLQTDDEDEGDEPYTKQGCKHVFCGQCDAVHGDVPRRDVGRFGTLCPRCYGLRGTNGHGGTPCGARAAARTMCMRGLISVRRWRTNGGASWITTHSRPAAELLKSFGHLAELAQSNYAGSTPAAMECWTTQEGIDTLLIIQCAAREHLTICNPAAGRLFQQHPDIFDEFRVLWRMDGSHELLGKTLAQIKEREVLARRARLNGLPKNVRPRKPQRRLEPTR